MADAEVDHIGRRPRLGGLRNECCPMSRVESYFGSSSNDKLFMQ